MLTSEKVFLKPPAPTKKINRWDSCEIGQYIYIPTRERKKWINISLFTFGPMVSSLLLLSQSLDGCTLRSSSGVCQSRLTWGGYQVNPLFNLPRPDVYGYEYSLFLLVLFSCWSLCFCWISMCTFQPTHWIHNSCFINIHETLSPALESRT